MGGELEVRSRIGEGSSFCLVLDLPIAPINVQENSPEDTVTQSSPFAGMSVLVVEDHPLQAELIAAVLQALQAKTKIVTCH